jgi:hypothetical protein
MYRSRIEYRTGFWWVVTTGLLGQNPFGNENQFMFLSRQAALDMVPVLVAQYLRWAGK